MRYSIDNSSSVIRDTRISTITRQQHLLQPTNCSSNLWRRTAFNKKKWMHLNHCTLFTLICRWRDCCYTNIIFWFVLKFDSENYFPISVTSFLGSTKEVYRNETIFYLLHPNYKRVLVHWNFSTWCVTISNNNKIGMDRQLRQPSEQSMMCLNLLLWLLFVSRNFDFRGFTQFQTFRTADKQ